MTWKIKLGLPVPGMRCVPYAVTVAARCAHAAAAGAARHRCLHLAQCLTARATAPAMPATARLRTVAHHTADVEPSSSITGNSADPGPSLAAIAAARPRRLLSEEKLLRFHSDGFL